MKQLNLIVAGILLVFAIPLHAQISQGGSPLGKTKSLSLAEVPVKSLSSFDLDAVRAEDEQNEKDGNYPRIGRVRSVNMSPAEFGEWTELEEGGRLWRAAVRSRDALGLSLQFEDFELPQGAVLFMYSPEFKHVIGGFTEFNNHPSGIFSTQLIPSDEVVIEYFEPASVTNQNPFKLSGVLHAYRMVPGAEAESASRDFGDSDNCQVNVNCSEGNSWQDEKRGVARILVIEGQFGGWCTGSLVNNTAEDCTPYFLTALHCGENASASNMNQWVFYFNYESSGCSNGTSGQVPNNTMTGCARIADSDDGGGNSGSDYLLVEINNNVPQAYNPYYNGWSVSTSPSSSGVSIHHPAGDIKKISTYTSNLISTTWGGPSGTHWLVQWSSTANGHGVTEGGSSGSPIFNSSGQIVGTLTGGSSFCNNPTSPDLYGKMSYHWGSNPGDDLSDFLDPGNTGVTSLNGANEPCASGGCTANIPYPESDPCVQTVIAADSDCCNGTWDAACESAYEVCSNSGGDCVADIPYPESDPCVQTVIAADDFCCNDTWDDICQDAYDDCNGTGGDCEAGDVSVSLTQNICPDETGIFDADNVTIPDGGGYAVQFVPNGGTGGNEVGFSITGVQPLPYEFDADMNGILSSNSLPPLSGQWVATGLVYTDPDDFANSVCSQTDLEITLDFLDADDPECSGGGCVADIPYPESDPCVQTVITEDDFCCNSEWDDICQEAYDDCNGTGGDCEAGDVSVSLSQNICPDETGIFDADNVTIPDGGGYAVQFLPDGGTGGNEVGFSITGVQPLPFEFDSDINGILSSNDLPPLSGQWTATGLVYSDSDDFANTVCSETDFEVTLNFLSANDPLCDGSGGPANDDCSDATSITPGVYPFSSVGATTDGPDQPGSDCDAFDESNVNNDIWYEYTATCDGTASFSTCGTIDFDSRLAVYPGEQCPPTAGSLIACNDDGDGCEEYSSFLEWNISAGTTYLLRIGGYSAGDVGGGNFSLIEDCDGGGGPCTDWVDPTPTTGYVNFNQDFGGAPANDGTGCPVYEITDFEVWMSEAYAMDNIVEGTSYTFSNCNGPGAGSWVPDYTIIAPSGAIDASGAGDGDGCSITWTASESGTYLIVINEAGNCGNAAAIDNGYPAITCNDEVTGIEDDLENAFHIFPNPNSGQFNITYRGEAGLADVEVLEVSGKTVKSSQFAFTNDAFLPVDLGNRATGMYFVRITMNEQVIVQKVMVR